MGDESGDDDRSKEYEMMMGFFPQMWSVSQAVGGLNMHISSIEIFPSLGNQFSPFPTVRKKNPGASENAFASYYVHAHLDGSSG